MTGSWGPSFCEWEAGSFVGLHLQRMLGPRLAADLSRTGHTHRTVLQSTESLDLPHGPSFLPQLFGQRGGRHVVPEQHGPHVGERAQLPRTAGVC